MRHAGNRYPTHIRRKAVKMYGEGHAATAIGRQLGIGYSTITKWADEMGVKKGSLAAGKLRDLEGGYDEMDPPVTDLDAIVTLSMKPVADAEEKRAIAATAVAAPTPAEKYQSLVAANALKMLETTFAAPPVCKNMRDLKTLTEILDSAFGVSSKKGAGNRLSIDLSVLSKAPVTVDAEII